MKAVVRERYGAALEVRDVATPEIGERGVLVAVRAAGVDQGVWHLATGRPYLIRAAGFGLRRPRVAGLGMDVAGVVAAVGAQVTRLRVGDEVFGVGDATFAEYAASDEDRLALKPANVSFVQAGAAACSGVAALQALRDKARVRPGQRVLVLGAGGGVGSFAVQMGKCLGSEVTAVCSAGKVELVRSLGAACVVDYAAGEPRGDVGRHHRHRRRAVTFRIATATRPGRHAGDRRLGAGRREVAAGHRPAAARRPAQPVHAPAAHRAHVEDRSRALEYAA
ncbi:hypothetical protein GCM10018962_49070 [Dactylosporangium matsuzakiense]